MQQRDADLIPHTSDVGEFLPGLRVFRPTDNSLFSRHLTHQFLLCLLEQILMDKVFYGKPYFPFVKV
jgi:hypothetical protein